MPSGETTWTPEQKAAIEFKGRSMLVSAAAGAGKTSVLVEKVIEQVLSKEEPCDIERLLVVTFTEKAALEMKERIRSALQRARDKSPDDARISRQLSLLERAQISTIHSFCLAMVRRYFYRVDLDPGFRVLDSNEAELLRYEALDEVFESWYRTDSQEHPIFSGLVERYGGRGVDESLKETVLRLHDFSSTQPSPEEWFESTFGWYEEVGQLMAKLEPDYEEGTLFRISATGLDEMVLRLPWARVLLDTLFLDLDEAIGYAEEACAVCLMPSGPESYLPVIEEELLFFRRAKELVYKACLFAKNPELILEVQDCADKPKGFDGLSQIRAISEFQFQRLPSRKKNLTLPELAERARDFRNKSKAAFQRIGKNTLMRPSDETLREIKDLTPFMKCLGEIVLDLDGKYTEKKKDRGGVDFSDLEKYCLNILRQDDSRLAQEVRSGYDYVFVDEYQDTNPVQDRILSLVSTPDNLFMVGDIKQSIYRFRLAEPRIFLEKYLKYENIEDSQPVSPDVPGVKVCLSKNFRSRKEVVNAVNYLFERIMKEDVAEIDYTDDHILNAGACYPEEPKDSSTANLWLVERKGELGAQGPGQNSSTEQAGFSENGSLAGPDDYSDIEEYEALEKEALVVASEIQKLVDSEKPFKVWDPKKSRFRNCTYKDIAILLRATKDRANVLIDIFQRCGIPAYSELGTGYFRAREVEVALSILSVIDNPRQDIPLAAVLRSPIVGLSPGDLAIIKALMPGREFYESLKHFASMADGQIPFDVDEVLEPQVHHQECLDLSNAVSEFLERLVRWRTMARRMPLAYVLWAILGETGYYDYVGGLPGGAQRQANLRALVNRAIEFDGFGRHGLFRFLRFIEKIQESKGDLGTARALGEQEDVVQILSIHKSKGLEFPVVFVVDLGKQFNMEDLRSDILFHKDLGIGSMFCDLTTRVKYPSLAYKANWAQIRKDNLAEEMRVLYVAMTRAREKLYLVGSARGLLNQIDKWKRPNLHHARTYLDWICPAIIPECRHEQCVEASGICCNNMEQMHRGPEAFSNQVPGDSEAMPFQVKIWGVPGAFAIPEPFLDSQPETSVTWNEVKNLLVPASPEDPVVYSEVEARLEWDYIYRPFSVTPAKMSVGELKTRMDFEDEEWKYLPGPEKRLAFAGSKAGRGVERGIAVHALLAKMDLAKGASEGGVFQEIERLSAAGFLDKSYIGAEDILRICEFFRTPTGQLLVFSPERVKREVPFTMGLDVRLDHTSGNEITGPAEVILDLTDDFKVSKCSSEYDKKPLGQDPGRAGNEARNERCGMKDSLLVQGVVDVIIQGDDGLTILDYKTDSIGVKEVPQAKERYMPQVALYSYAAEKITGIPIKRSAIVFLTLGKEIEIDWREYMSRISAGRTQLSKVMGKQLPV